MEFSVNQRILVTPLISPLYCPGHFCPCSCILGYIDLNECCDLGMCLNSCFLPENGWVVCLLCFSINMNILTCFLFRWIFCGYSSTGGYFFVALIIFLFSILLLRDSFLNSRVSYVFCELEIFLFQVALWSQLTFLLACGWGSSSESERETSSHSRRHKHDDKPKKVVLHLCVLIFLLICWHYVL